MLMHSLASPAAMLALQKAADVVVFEEGHASHAHGHAHVHGEKQRGKHLLGDTAAVESSEEDEDISELTKKPKTERVALQPQPSAPSQTDILRLRKIQEGLRSTGYFDAVELNSDRTQLIVRKEGHDAYCKIVWGAQQKHQAAVECEDQLLKDLLVFCLSNANELLKGSPVPPLPKVLQELLAELEEAKLQRAPMAELGAGNDSWGVEVPGLAPLKGALTRRASTSSSY